MSYKILIADDEESIRYSYSEILTGEGYEVETSATLDDCLNSLSSGDFDLLFLDIWFGRDNGIDALKTIQQYSPECDIVMITGNPQPSSIIQSRQHGVRDYLAKPVRKASLLYVTEHVLSLKQNRSSAS
ncbi:MAG: hypothetical protein C0624_06745 [Desulfuromonas sp.]|nr:MAG: hypothetical protein C0624_06745 [Desulfuromonas sp.]